MQQRSLFGLFREFDINFNIDQHQIDRNLMINQLLSINKCNKFFFRRNVR